MTNLNQRQKDLLKALREAAQGSKGRVEEKEKLGVLSVGLKQYIDSNPGVKVCLGVTSPYLAFLPGKDPIALDSDGTVIEDSESTVDEGEVSTPLSNGALDSLNRLRQGLIEASRSKLLTPGPKLQEILRQNLYMRDRFCLVTQKDWLIASRGEPLSRAKLNNLHLLVREDLPYDELEIEPTIEDVCKPE